MNVALYSLGRLDIKTLERLFEKITHRLIVVDNIFIYSENTNKQRMSKRDGFRKMLDDYSKGKITVVAFENLQTLSDDEVVRGEMFQQLMEKRIKFFFIENELESATVLGRVMIDSSIFISNKIKEMNITRSNNARKYKERESYKK